MKLLNLKREGRRFGDHGLDCRIGLVVPIAHGEHRQDQGQPGVQAGLEAVGDPPCAGDVAGLEPGQAFQTDL